MPLTASDRKFLKVVARFKIYLLMLALAVFVFLFFLPSSEIQSATCVLGIALCAVFWLTHRLLSLITLLDFELMRVASVLKRSFTAEPQEKRALKA